MRPFPESFTSTFTPKSGYLYSADLADADTDSAEAMDLADSAALVNLMDSANLTDSVDLADSRDSADSADSTDNIGYL